jgi:hypothetical protein
MSGLLVWASSLAASLLLLALAAALLGPRPRGAGLARLVYALVLLPAAGLTGLAVIAWFARLLPNVLPAVASWALAFGVGGALLLRRGLARGDEGRRAAAAWPRGRLVAAALAAAFAFGLAFEHADTESRLWLADVAARHRANVASLEPGPVPEDENAALAYEEAFEQLDALSGLPAWFGQCGAPCPGTSARPEDAEHLSRVAQPTLRLLRRAAALPRYRFGGIDHVDPWRTPIPNLLDHRRSANLLAWDAVRRSRQGDGAGAAADLVAAWRMAGHLAEGGHTLIECLMAVAIQGIGADALEDALAAGSWRAEEIAALAGTRPPSFRSAFLRGLRMEESTFALSIAGMAGVGAGPIPFPEEPWLVRRLPAASALYRIAFVPEDLLSYGEWVGEARALLERGKGTRREWEALEASVVSARKGSLASIVLPSLLRARHSATEAEARARLARLALAATAYQLRNGKYPATLDELVPAFVDAVPVDPFGGRPLRMTAADGGLVLYSVGGDGTDDGGAEERRGMGGLKGDVTFCLGAAYGARGRGPAAAPAAPRR